MTRQDKPSVELRVSENSITFPRWLLFAVVSIVFASVGAFWKLQTSVTALEKIASNHTGILQSISDGQRRHYESQHVLTEAYLNNLESRLKRIENKLDRTE